MKACVLLSTYNGAAFIERQLISLLSQEYSPLSIIVRDDGSVDETAEIVGKYQRRYDNILFVAGSNIGVTSSFFSLLRMAPQDSQYFAFCDQDDEWAKDKISRAISMLGQAKDVPRLYCSRLEIVDQDLKYLGLSAIPKRGPSLGNALVQNIVTGCTAVFNDAARRLAIRSEPDTTRIFMHDWWMYLLVSAMGEVVYDPTPSIKYRQHASNVVGHAVGLANFIKRVRRFIRERNAARLVRQAEEFLRCLPDASPGAAALVRKFVLGSRGNCFDRLMYSFGGEVKRQTVMDDLILKVLIVSGRLS